MQGKQPIKQQDIKKASLITAMVRMAVQPFHPPTDPGMGGPAHSLHHLFTTKAMRSNEMGTKRERQTDRQTERGGVGGGEGGEMGWRFVEGGEREGGLWRKEREGKLWRKERGGEERGRGGREIDRDGD